MCQDLSDASSAARSAASAVFFKKFSRTAMTSLQVDAQCQLYPI